MPEAVHTVFLPLVAKPEPLPPSETLIDRALERGEIDAETALIYKVYAAFGDSRLPAQYRGDDSMVIDNPIMTEVAGRFNSLSPAAQAILAPFTLPPFHAGSWLELRDNVSQAAAAGHVQAASEYRCGRNGAPRLEEWNFILTNNGEAKVWWQKRYPEDAAKARAIAEAIDTPIWLKLASLIGRKPLPDNGSSILCRGGDDRLDISLTNISDLGLTVPYGSCKVTPTHILIRRDAKIAIVVHELMHAIQFTYQVADTCMYSNQNAWWAEASATWAEDYVYPGAPNPEQPFAFSFLNAPELPLEDRSDHHEYGAYLWPFFLDRSLGQPGVVRTIWENMERYPDSLEAINVAIPGGFKTQWPLFARANWNRKPVDYYWQWDSLLPGAKTVGTLPKEAPSLVRIVNLLGRPEVQYTLNAEVGHLAAHYYHFYFNDINARSVAFHNPFFSPYGTLWPTARIQALIKIAGQDWQPPQDWTNQSGATFCRDMRAERIEQLVIIISNSEWQDREHVLKPSSPPRLVATNIGCWRWTGASIGIYENESFKITATAGNVTVQRWRPPALPLVRLEYEEYLPVMGRAGMETGG